MIDVLAPFMKEKRVRRQVDSLNKRRANCHIVLENLSDPFNAAGVLRTIEACGVQHVHLIESVSAFQLPANVAHASARGALGRADATGDAAGRWLTLHRHTSTRAAIDSLRDDFGLTLYVSDCPTPEQEEEDGDEKQQGSSSSSSSGNDALEGMGWVQSGRPHVPAKAIHEIDFRECFEGEGEGGGGAAFCFGNERRGCSKLLVESAHQAFYLPMCGFTQSFNIGVALGMTLTAAPESIVTFIV